MQVSYGLKRAIKILFYFLIIVNSYSVADSYPRSYGYNRGRPERPIHNSGGRFSATPHPSRIVREVEYPEEEEDDVLMD